MILFLYYPAYIDDIPTNHGGSKPRLPIFGGSVHPVLPSRIYAHTESVLVMEVAAGDSLSNFIKQNHSKEKRSLDQLWLWINSYENTILGGMNIYIHINHIYIYLPAILLWTNNEGGFFVGFDPSPNGVYVWFLLDATSPILMMIKWRHCDIGNFCLYIYWIINSLTIWDSCEWTLQWCK